MRKEALIFDSEDINSENEPERLDRIPGIEFIEPFGMFSYNNLTYYTTDCLQSNRTPSMYPRNYIVRTEGCNTEYFINFISSCLYGLFEIMSEKEKEQFLDNLPEIMDLLGQ